MPDDLRELFGERQWGFHLDAVVPLFRPRIRGLTDPVVSAIARVERVDFNRGSFASTGDPIGDEIDAFTLGRASARQPVPCSRPTIATNRFATCRATHPRSGPAFSSGWPPTSSGRPARPASRPPPPAARAMRSIAARTSAFGVARTSPR